MWGGNVDVTLVERNAQFVSCPISNLVVGGYRQIGDVTRGYDGLKALGVKVVQGDVVAIDAAAKKLRLASGPELGWGRLEAAARSRVLTNAGGGPRRATGQSTRSRSRPRVSGSHNAAIAAVASATAIG